MNQEIVEAGAGCGKTYGLVTRYLAALGVYRGEHVAELKKYKQHSPSKILTLTFTNDAADEMRERIVSALEELGKSDLASMVQDEGKISTFHSFCYKVLRPHLSTLGYRDHEILSQVESYNAKVNHILEVLSKSLFSTELQKILDLKHIISFCIKNWRTPPKAIRTDVLATYSNVSQITHSWIQETLSELKLASSQRPDLFEEAESWPYLLFEALSDLNWPLLNTINFNKGKRWYKQAFPELEQKAKAAREFAKEHFYVYLDQDTCNQEVKNFEIIFSFLEEVQTTAPKLLDFDALEHEILEFTKHSASKLPKYDLIIVDEFQDTNQKQVEILNHFKHANTELYFVGDPKQSIYAFRGGDVKVFAEQKKQLSHSTLSVNRRSQPEVLDFMNALTKEIFVDKDDPFAQVLETCPEKTHISTLEPSSVFIKSGLDKKESGLWDELATDLKKYPSSSRAILCQKWSTASEAHKQLAQRGLQTRLGDDLDLSKHHLSGLWLAYLKSIDPKEDLVAKKHWQELCERWNLDTCENLNSSQDVRSWLKSFVNAVRPHRWPSGLLWLASVESWAQSHATQWRWIPSPQELASSFQKSFQLRQNLESSRNPATEIEESSSSEILITTIHKSKGLQYEIVYLFDLFNGKLNNSNQTSDAEEDENLISFKLKTNQGSELTSLYFKKRKSLDDHKTLSEKKRLFYVAYTRAERHLYFYQDELRDTPQEKSKSLEPEHEIWNWPKPSKLLWSHAISAAAKKLANKPFVNLISFEKPTEEKIAADSKTILWQLPLVKPQPLHQPRASFYKLGARRYIDEVLLKEQENAFALKQRELFKLKDLPPTHWINLGSALHKILETWNGCESTISDALCLLEPYQQQVLTLALTELSQFPDLSRLWDDMQNSPERVHRELGVFVHDDAYRISGFADLVWYPEPDTAIILDWKSSGTKNSAFDPIKIAKTKAQVSLYAKALSPVIKNIEIWSLAIIFEPKPQLTWLFKEPYKAL